MGTQVDSKGYSPPGHCEMRNFSEDGSSSNWSLFYGDRPLTNGQYCNNNNFLSRTVIDAFPGYDKDAVKQKMLEHEAIFKNQVYELHRLYRIQRDMMQEAKRKEPNRMSLEPSSSSSIRGSQLPSEDARKWQMTSLPLAHSNYYTRPSTCSADLMSSPLSCAKGNSVQLQNGLSSRISGEDRPSKVRKKLFDLQLPADQYIKTDDEKPVQDCNVKLALGSEMSSFRKEASRMSDSPFGFRKEASRMSDSPFGLADLNEPAQFEEPADFLGHCSKRQIVGDFSVDGKGKERDGLSYAYESDNKLPMPSHCQNPAIYPTIGIRGEMWRERTGYERGGESSSQTRPVDPTPTFWPLAGKPTQSFPFFHPNPVIKKGFYFTGSSSIMRDPPEKLLSASKSPKGFDLNVMNEEEEKDIPVTLPTEGQNGNSTKKKNVVIDINMAWDGSIDEPDEPKAKKVKNQIDLNFCVQEEGMETGPVIDLEEENLAAEAIVAISTKSLHCLADVVSSYEKEEEDSFEAMTLELAETEEADFMPKPFLPEVPNGDLGPAPGRPRRGQARRGRQKRDFQRDILPGLSTLSRQDLTEDLQTFGNLMKAMGHPWTCALTTSTKRTGGSARGRRRAVADEPPPPPPPPEGYSNVEAVLDEKSLTGWGKATRRPRRQRCPPAGTLT